jgi:DNA-binding CsgD family transcriptional regulator
MAYRAGEMPVSLRRSVRDLRAEGARQIILGPLDDAAAAQVIEDVVTAHPDDALRRFAGRAGGNPLMVIELLRGLLDEGLLVIDGDAAILLDERLPARVTEGMHEALERVSPPARDLAAAAAALGRSVRFDDLCSMLATPPAALLGPVSELVRSELLAEDGGQLHFRHDLLREGVLASIPPSTRRALRRQAAQVLLAAGIRPLELATRFASSSEPGDEVAIVTLLEAGQALAVTDPGGAGDLVRAALALTAETDPRRPGLIAQAAILLHAAGRDVEARDFADDAMRWLPPAAEAAVRLSIAQLFSLPADLRVQTGRTALELPGVPPDIQARHRAVLVLSLVAASQVGAAIEMAAQAEAAVAALATEEAALAAVAPAGDASARLNLEFGRLALDEATFAYSAVPMRIASIRRLGAAAGESAQVLAADWFRSSVLAHLDRLDEALDVVEEGLATAQRQQQAWIAPRWDIWRGWILLQQGRLADAGVVLEGAFMGEGLDLALALPDAAGLAALGQVAVHTADTRLARKCTQIARATLAAGAYDDARRHVVWMLAQQAMAQGDAVRARRELHAVTHGPGDAGVDVLPVLARTVGTEPHLVRLALAAGDAGLAEHAAAQAADRDRRNPGSPAIAGIAAHCRGLLDGDPAELVRAAGLLDGAARPLALASVLEDAGRAYQRAGGAGAARAAVAAFQRSLDLCTGTGAVWDAQRVRGRLAALGAVSRPVPESPSGWGSLSGSEAAVARLIARGRTNRQVADELHLSQHTVNTYLRRVFAKLDIHSRVELTRIVVQSD